MFFVVLGCLVLACLPIRIALGDEGVTSTVAKSISNIDYGLTLNFLSPEAQFALILFFVWFFALAVICIKVKSKGSSRDHLKEIRQRRDSFKSNLR